MIVATTTDKITATAIRLCTMHSCGYGAGAGIGLRPQSGACDGRQSPEYYRDNLFRHCYGQVLRPSRMRRRYATWNLLLLAPEAAPDEDSHPPLSHP